MQLEFRPMRGGRKKVEGVDVGRKEGRKEGRKHVGGRKGGRILKEGRIFIEGY